MAASITWKSSIIIEAAMAKKLDPIPPGEILAEEFMKPNGISQNRLARDIDVNPARINDIVHGRSSITASVALRLGKYFGTTPELWMNLQSDYDLRRARGGLDEGRAASADTCGGVTRQTAQTRGSGGLPIHGPWSPDAER
jgi:addiction module HigA family antidote